MIRFLFLIWFYNYIYFITTFTFGFQPKPRPPWRPQRQCGPFSAPTPRPAISLRMRTTPASPKSCVAATAWLSPAAPPTSSWGRRDAPASVRCWCRPRPPRPLPCQTPGTRDGSVTRRCPGTLRRPLNEASGRDYMMG
jgi:hypothetical protein